MKTLKTLTLVAIFSFLTSFSSLADECKIIDGGCWNTLKGGEKVLTLKTFQSGQAAAYLQASINDNTLSDLFTRNRYELPDKTTYKDVIDYLDKLYSFPINRNIELSKGMLLSAIYLADNDTNDRIGLLREFRENHEIPTSGKLQKIIDVNHLILKVQDGRDIEVTLPRISNAEISPEIKADALSIIQALLTKVGYDDKVCDEPNTNISLVYPLDFLDDEGRWRADIKIQGSKICLDGTPISLSELGISSNKFSLALFLLGNGVLKINGKNDPKWSQDVKFGAIFYDVWENNEGKPKELVKAILTSGSR